MVYVPTLFAVIVLSFRVMPAMFSGFFGVIVYVSWFDWFVGSIEINPVSSWIWVFTETEIFLGQFRVRLSA